MVLQEQEKSSGRRLCADSILKAARSGKTYNQSGYWKVGRICEKSLVMRRTRKSRQKCTARKATKEIYLGNYAVKQQLCAQKPAEKECKPRRWTPANESVRLYSRMFSWYGESGELKDVWILPVCWIKSALSVLQAWPKLALGTTRCNYVKKATLVHSTCCSHVVKTDAIFSVCVVIKS